MDEKTMTKLLSDLLLAFYQGDVEPETECETPPDACRTFEEAGVLTSNEGLVVYFPDGSEFQVTVVQSKGAF